jgi:D-alanyl-D-alanine carboxypeptidase (penicillin-binding protein 5/6)
MPPQEIPPNDISSTPNRLRTTGLVALLLLGLAAFSFVYAYMDNARRSTVSQVATVASAVDPFAGLSLEAKSVIVVDLTNGRTLFARNPDIQLPLASITKVALTLAVREVLSPDTVITIPYDTAPPGSVMRLAKGERWRLSDVINFTLIASSNEGANILAAAADDAIRARYPQAPQGSAALWRMNDLAQQLGLSHTYFLNVNGLDISTTQSGAYGSARDIATLFAYAASTSPDAFSGTTKDGLLLTDEQGNTTSAFNTNEALGAIPGLIMGKTGYTDLAGGNLAVMFDVGLAHPVVAVVLGSSHEGRFSDMRALVEAARQAVAQE